MTTIRVDAAEVAELGFALAETGADLLLMGDPSAERWALGPGVGPALEELLGGWRHVRLALGESLTGLGATAVEAGALYLDTEAGVSRSLSGGSWRAGCHRCPVTPARCGCCRPAGLDGHAAVRPGLGARPTPRRSDLGRPRGRGVRRPAARGRAGARGRVRAPGRGCTTPRSLAEAMEEAQGVVARAVLDVDEAQHAYAVLEDRAAALVAGGAAAGRPRVAARAPSPARAGPRRSSWRGSGTWPPPSGSTRPTVAAPPCCAACRSTASPTRCPTGRSSVPAPSGTTWRRSRPAATVLPELAPVVSVADALAVAAQRHAARGLRRGRWRGARTVGGAVRPRGGRGKRRGPAPRRAPSARRPEWCRRRG